jgi:hypothetical protein
MIQCHQTGRCVRASAAHAAAYRDTFQQADVGAERRGGGFFQCTRRTDAQIFMRRQTRYIESTPNLTIRAHLNSDLIAQIDELKTSLQLVVAVGSASNDM